MDTAILVSIITGIFTLAGTVIAVVAGNSATKEQIRINQAVTDTKLEDLTREVRKHNGFAERMPVMEEKIKVINHRIKDLEDSERNDET